MCAGGGGVHVCGDGWVGKHLHAITHTLRYSLPADREPAHLLVFGALFRHEVVLCKLTLCARTEMGLTGQNGRGTCDFCGFCYVGLGLRIVFVRGHQGAGIMVILPDVLLIVRVAPLCAV